MRWQEGNLKFASLLRNVQNKKNFLTLSENVLVLDAILVNDLFLVHHLHDTRPLFYGWRLCMFRVISYRRVVAL
jgi:hypothetical protein